MMFHAAMFKSSRAIVVTCFLAFLPAAALAQSSPGPATLATAPPQSPSSIVGVVRSSSGVPLAGAELQLTGAARRTTTSSANGYFAFNNLLPGVYDITVVKASFGTVKRTDIILVPAEQVTLNVELAPATFSSLKEIGHVSVSAGGPGGINTSSAAIVDIPAATFQDQGQQQVVHVLNQTPGIVTTVQNFGFNDNGAYQSAIQEPQIRGCLSYETESLIDGHPISIGSSGFYSPLYLNTHALQAVELVKGPGSMPTDINYAVCGSVNYRTLEPTRTQQAGVDFDLNSYGGLSSNYQVTGMTTNGRLGYAFDYAIVGQPGPFQSDPQYTGTLRIAPGTTINGKPICGPTLPYYVCAGSFPATPPGQTGALNIAYPIVMCCTSLNSVFTNKSELAKLRYSFSPDTSLTVAYLGAQAYQSLYTNYIFPQQWFNPYNPTYSSIGFWPAPSSGIYKGSLKTGFAVPYGTLASYQPDNEQNQQGLFESEFRTAVGKDTVLLRYYTGVQHDIIYLGNPDGTGSSSLSGRVWGILPTGANGAFQSYNGDVATISQPNGGTSSLIGDHFQGYSAEINAPLGSNLITLSFDRTSHNSFYDFAGSTIVPESASQALGTVMLRGNFAITPNLTALFGNYFVNYTSHYTPNGGATWTDVNKSFYGPRLALTWQPRSGTSIRASLGSSIAPPFLVLINTQGGPPVANNQGAALYYTQILNNGNLNPEVGFGWDLGADQRLGRDYIVSGDIYQTSLHGQFLNETTLDGTYTPPSGPNQGKTRPLYVTTTANLGQSRYEGIEASLRRVVPIGFGFTVQGALIRAYTYNLPPGFYDTAAGPNTTNLGVIPNVNFYGSGNGYNGVADGNVPYAQGYAEVNYRARNGAIILVGTTYYGNNNSYNAKAFFTTLASARYPINNNISVQLTGTNIFNVLGAKTGNLFGGQQTPLVNGTTGVTTAFNVGPPTVDLILHVGTGAP